MMNIGFHVPSWTYSEKTSQLVEQDEDRTRQETPEQKQADNIGKFPFYGISRQRQNTGKEQNKVGRDMKKVKIKTWHKRRTRQETGKNKATYRARTRRETEKGQG